MRTGSKIVGLVVMAAIAMTALTAPNIASAEETSLCLEDPAESFCPEEQAATHVHLVTTEKSTLLTFVNVECDVLFLGDTLEESSEPLLIHGTFTYTNCNNSCTVTEENGPSEIKALKTEHETAEVTGEGLVHISCGTINCRYTGIGLKATAKGPLLSAESNPNGEVSLKGQELNNESGTLCPKPKKLDIVLEPLEAIYITSGPSEEEKLAEEAELEEAELVEEAELAEEAELVEKAELAEFTPHKTALCTADDPTPACEEEHKPSSIDFKDGAAEFLTSLISSKCEGLISSVVGAAGKPQVAEAEYKFSSCTNGCVVTEISGGSNLLFLYETSEKSTEELASVTTESLELFYKCGETVKCAYGPIKAIGDGLGALKTGDNGHITFSKDSLGKGEGLLCPTEATLDGLFVASSATYIREDYLKPPTSLCSKDEKSPFCKSENQLKSIDYKDKAVELLTNLINVKCEGLASGTVGTPAAGKPLEVKTELTYTSCSGGCFVTAVSGPGKIMLERNKSEEATATSEGFEIFVKCGTTIKCLLGPEKMAGQALGALTTGDNGHLTFSKVSMGKGEGATCPSKAELDALFVASSAAYIG